MSTKLFLRIILGLTAGLFIGIGVQLFLFYKDYDPVGIGNGNAYEFQLALYGPKGNEMRNPIDLAVSNDGTVYVTDSDNHRIQIFKNNGEYIGKFGEFGDKKNEFDYPVGVAVNSQNEVFVAELNNMRISVYDKKGKFLRFFDTKDKMNNEKFGIIPTAMTIDSKDNVYIIDKTDQTVKRFNKDGFLELRFGGIGKGRGQFQYPLGIHVNKKGDIFVTDTGNNRIQVFDKSGKNILVTDKKINTPSGIFADDKGLMYITDTTSNKIIIADQYESANFTLGVVGTSNESFYIPEGLEIKDNYLYVADKGNSRIVIYKVND
ncbi:MAG: repeat containing protein [Bacillales bacterium]|jgi:DNA-binding beta-propeller fold protein YncE|nr:repeat containing protein [Bacillales bacterium]